MARPDTVLRGEENPRAKLTDRDVRTMRRMYSEDGLCIKCIAHMFDVAYATANHIIRRRTWTHIEDEATNES